MADSKKDTATIEKLFKLTMEKKWEEVAGIYETEHLSWVHKSKLTKQGDTALHIALLSYNGVSTIESHIRNVTRMIDRMSKDALSVKNVKGNTPLHIAATVGWKDICKHICKVKEQHWELITQRNEMHETPLFVAARHGQKDSFNCLRIIYVAATTCKNKQEEDTKYPPTSGDQETVEPCESLCRRRDGNTALHLAISKESFDLAIDLIQSHRNLVDDINLEGESALHVLAKKTHIFEAVREQGHWDSLLYKYAVETPLPWSRETSEAKNSETTFTMLRLPQHYETCFNIFSFFKEFICYGIMPECRQISFRKKKNADAENPPNEKKQNNGSPTGAENSSGTEKKVGFFPANYRTLIHLLKFAASIILTIVGVGLGRIGKMQRNKKRYLEALELVKEMVAKESIKYGNDGQMPTENTALAELYKDRIEPPSMEPIEDDDASMSSQDTEKHPDNSKGKRTQKIINSKDKDQQETGKERKSLQRMDTAFLLAARKGVCEIVDEIFDKLPIAIYDVDSKGRNVLMVAAESRETSVFYNLVRKNLAPHIFQHLDDQGNNIIHVAAMLEPHSKPWRIPGDALQMQREIKWLEQVKRVRGLVHFAHDINDKGITPDVVFTETHSDQMKKGYEWLIKTSESCSVVAALVAGVAFTTTATVPGGLNQQNGRPMLEGEVAFNVFSISSLISLCLSVTALVLFLSIITSRCLEKDFKSDLPKKLLSGLTCLFSSIVGMLVSFCAGHTFVLTDSLNFVEVPVYSLACIPITLFVLAQMPLYADLVKANWKRDVVYDH